MGVLSKKGVCMQSTKKYRTMRFLFLAVLSIVWYVAVFASEGFGVFEPRRLQLAGLATQYHIVRFSVLIAVVYVVPLYLFIRGYWLIAPLLTQSEIVEDDSGKGHWMERVSSGLALLVVTHGSVFLSFSTIGLGQKFFLPDYVDQILTIIYGICAVGCILGMLYVMLLSLTPRKCWVIPIGVLIFYLLVFYFPLYVFLFLNTKTTY